MFCVNWIIASKVYKNRNKTLLVTFYQSLLWLFCLRNQRITRLKFYFYFKTTLIMHFTGATQFPSSASSFFEHQFSVMDFKNCLKYTFRGSILQISIQHRNLCILLPASPYGSAKVRYLVTRRV